MAMPRNSGSVSTVKRNGEVNRQRCKLNRVRPIDLRAYIPFLQRFLS